MRRRYISGSRLFILPVGFLIFFVTGCASLEVSTPRSGSGFLRREFLDYKSVAVLPFGGDNSGEVCDAFAEGFQKRFSQVLVVDRQQVLKVLGPTRPLDRLDDVTREEVGKTFGAEAIIRGEVYYPSIVKWFLQVEIVDTKTGRILGRSLVEMDYMGALGKRDAGRLAVDKLTLW